MLSRKDLVTALTATIVTNNKSKKPSCRTKTQTAQDRNVATLIRSAESDATLAARFDALTTRFEALIATCVRQTSTGPISRGNTATCAGTKLGDPARRTADSATRGEAAQDILHELVENQVKYYVWAIFIAVGATVGRLFGPAGVSILSVFALIGASLMARSERRAIAGALVVIRPTLKGERNTTVNASSPSTSLETRLATSAALLGALYVIFYALGILP
jgi:hypothetical protein